MLRHYKNDTIVQSPLAPHLHALSDKTAIWIFSPILLVAHSMASAQSEITWPNYTIFINAVARVDPDFEWLARFLSQHQQRRFSGGQLNILESHGDTIKDNACSLDDLDIPPKVDSTRIVVLSYEEVWSLNRELLDKVALALNLSPYFLWQHLEYQGHNSESAFPDPLGGPYYMRPSAAASEILSLEIGWTPYFHMSAMIASPKTSSTGSVGLSSR